MPILNGRNPHRGALVKLSAQLSGVNYSAGVNIPWDAEEYDTDGFHDNVTNNTRLTVPAGVSKVRLSFYVITANVTANTNVFASIRKNDTAPIGSVAIVCDTDNTNPRVNGVSPVLSVAAGDYFEVQGIWSDTSVDITTGSWFAIEVVE